MNMLVQHPYAWLNGHKKMLTHQSRRQEPHEEPCPSYGGQVVVGLGKSQRFSRRQLESSLKKQE